MSFASRDDTTSREIDIHTLNSHAGYVATHPECADDLAAFRADGKRRMKRATHAEIAFHKRDAQLFYIVPQDHILDMATRAFSSESKNTFGGYVSTTLSLWNKVKARRGVERFRSLRR